MKIKIDLKKIIKLMIAVALCWPFGLFFHDLATNKNIQSETILYFWTLMGVLVAITLGLFVLPFLSDLIASQFLNVKLTFFWIFRKKGFLLDSSAILDGRVVELISNGLIDKPIFVSSITIDELNRLKNTSDIYQIRVKRGFETIEAIKSIKKNNFKIIEIAKSPKSIRDHLIELATKIGAGIITLDSSLSDMSRKMKKPVININEVAIAFRTHIHPKEQFEVLLTKPGKEQRQAIGYLEDGVMVIVEDGKPYINKRILAECTSVLQSNAGKILFAKYLHDVEIQ